MNIPELYSAGDGIGAEQLRPRNGRQPSDRLNMHEIMGVFHRRITLFALVTFIVFELAQLITWVMPTTYSAMSQIAVIRTSDQVAPKGSNVVDGDTNSADVDTAVEVLTSRELASKVSDALGLARDPTFLRPDFKGDRKQGAIDLLIKNLDVERVKTAFVINLTYQDTDPVRSAKVANTFAAIYSQDQVNDQRRANAKAMAFLGGQIARLREQAQSDMQALQEYRIRNNLLSTTGATLTEQEISTYHQQVAQARAQAIEDAARLATAKKQLMHGENGTDIGESLSSPVIQSLREQRATLSAKVADLSSHYGPQYPDLVEARSQLRDIDLATQTEVLRELSTLDAAARVSAQRLASLEGSLGGASAKLAQNNRAMVTLDDLTRRATTSQELYQSYLDRYKQVAAQTGTEAPSARVVSQARIPASPSSPSPILNLALGAVLGVLLGAASAIAAELYFTGLTTGDEVESRLGLPYLGGIPDLRSIKPREATPLATVEQFPRSGFAESFRAVLASVRHGNDGRHNVIAVSSPLPGEGKSTVAICLAAARALGSNDRIIALDLDITRHRLSDLVVKDKTRPGLREVLREGAPVDDALVQVLGSNLFVLPVTSEFGRDEQLTRAGLVHTLIAKLREHFQLIILDCPPLLAVAEARDLASLADDIILVAAWRRTKESALRSAIRLLPPQSVARTGITLTKIDMKKQARFGAGDPTAFYRKYREYYSA